MDAGQIAFEVMDALRACLDERLAVSPGGSPCFVGIVPGDQAAADHCNCTKNLRGQQGGCGQGWVRLSAIYPHGPQFPNQEARPTCYTPLAAVIELGVYRCLPTLNGQGQAPDAAAQAEAVRIQTGDAAAMMAAFSCCTALTDRDYSLGRYTPAASGGCGGGVWPVTVALRNRP